MNCKSLFSLFAVVGFLIVSQRFAAAYPPPDCAYYSTWSAATYPTVSVYYSGIPEPGLTNESMIIAGWWSGSAGVLLDSETSDACPPRSDYEGWPEVIYFSSSQGTLTTNADGTFSVSIIPSQIGNQQLELLITGTATNQISYIASALYVIPYSVFPEQRLAYLSFNNSTLEGDLGQLPTNAVNIIRVPSPFGSGINFDSGSGIDLKYPAYQNDVFSVINPFDASTVYSTGSPNVRLNEGTVRFWYSPNWSSGSGPSSGVLFQMLGSSGSMRKIQIASSGSSIQIDSRSFPVNLIAGHWYQIAATYSASGTAIYTNGVQAGTTGGGVSGTTYVAIDSFRVGSDGGSGQARGIMDEVETFNYVQSSAEILAAYQAASAIDADGDGIPDLQEFQSGLDPADPPGGNPVPIPPPALDPGDTTPPIINLLEPINAVKQ